MGQERPPCERVEELDSSNSTPEASPTSTTIRVSTSSSARSHPVNRCSLRHTQAMDRDPLAVRDDILLRWAQAAMTLRSLEDVLARCVVPRAGSDAAAADAAYPRESYSQWATEGLRSALDHMLVWADATIPIDERAHSLITHSGFRWFYTLLRAAIEGASQSLWLTAVANSGEAVARLIRAVRDDLREQRIAWSLEGRSLQLTDQRIDAHAAAAKEWSQFGTDTDRLPAYVDRIRAAAARSKVDPDKCEAVWRRASAAAHGKIWAIVDLQTFVGPSVEWRPGQFHTPGIVDQERLTDSIDIAVALLSRASEALLFRNGFDAVKEYQVSMIAVARRTPMKDGGARVEAVARMLGID